MCVSELGHHVKCNAYYILEAKISLKSTANTLLSLIGNLIRHMEKIEIEIFFFLAEG